MVSPLNYHWTHDVTHAINCAFYYLCIYSVNQIQLLLPEGDTSVLKASLELTTEIWGQLESNHSSKLF